MAGHSKWANIKHRKAAQDAKRGVAFQKLVRAIIVAAREGGGDPSMNMKLKTALERAKSASVPSDNIDRAIKRGTGEIEGAVYEEVMYEAYGPGGVAVLIEATTDNKNRTTPEIRALLSRNGGTFGEAGCVAWIFERRGVVEIQGAVDEEELMMAVIDAGGEDLSPGEEGITVYTDPGVVMTVAEALKKTGYHVESAEVQHVPKTTIPIEEKDVAAKILNLLNVLDDHDDVQAVSCNFDISEDIANSLEN
ncbi:MAG TPA: YebC/PmpR family DNA-binding transcriptional regulator [Synergistaceae bacterium]|nr:YebC/PmpR family DNA-binding transcriptional regulator [Synergistaceae bacterium]HPJ24621.1 YebC/PmpR family DNA-binding transcriptional regulator [Synergistaceae bacterium]HPQ36184.1 YebC/PmpR family DNA-binding transcriptional regulator [Synergistaceae bacterium]